MNEQEIIESADTIKKLISFFGCDQYLDLRRWNWRVDVSWIDIAFTEEFNRPHALNLVMMSEGGPECYVEMRKITVAMIDKDGIEYLGLFDNELKGV